MKAVIAMAAMLFAASSLVLSASPASATPPGKNGRIAYRLFLNNDQTHAAIFTIKPNGTDRRRVTHPAPGVAHVVPDWSTDGHWIAYVRVHKRFWDTYERPDRPRIIRIHRDGTGRKDLSTSCTAPCLWHDDPAWSPGDGRIAFSAYIGDARHPGSLEIDLMLMRADGTHVRHLTHHPDKAHADFQPAWAPNGKRLAFSRYSGRRDASAIFTIRPNGSDLRRVTPWSGGEFPDWSPNGRWIVLTGGGRKNISLVRPNGTGRHQITTITQGEWISSTFSPDGTKIVTSHTPAVGGKADVFVMNPDGSGLRNLTQSRRWDSGPDWGPRPE
jgi:Tol biopolymer transport system component